MSIYNRYRRDLNGTTVEDHKWTVQGLAGDTHYSFDSAFKRAMEISEKKGNDPVRLFEVVTYMGHVVNLSQITVRWNDFDDRTEYLRLTS